MVFDSEHLLIIDANYVDSVVSDFKNNINEMQKRELGDVHLQQFAMCIAMDGGLKSGNNDVTIVMVCRNNKTQMQHIVPKNLKAEADAKAFTLPEFGEFSISVVEDPEDFNLLGDRSLFVQITELALASPKVKNLTVVASWNQMCDDIVDVVDEALNKAGDRESKPKVTIVTDTPDKAMDNYTLMHIGFDVLHCLGVTVEELREHAEKAD